MEVWATVLTGAGVLLGVWRMVEGVRRDLGGQIAGVRQDLHREIATVNARFDTEMGAVRNDIRALNGRIDAVLLADRQHA